MRPRRRALTDGRVPVGMPDRRGPENANVSTGTIEKEAQQALWSDLPQSKRSHGAQARSLPARRIVPMPPPELEAALRNPGDVLFLDIETTGLSRYYDDLTIVGYERRGVYRVHVTGDDESDLRAALKDSAVLVTFNGKLFDVPFLIKTFPDLAVPPSHLDLRFASRRVGLSGGQKAIEGRLGLSALRAGVAAGDGAEAVLLWHRYLRGDVDALRDLIAYNRADVHGMMGIFDHIVDWYDAGRDLLAPRIPFLLQRRGAEGVAGGARPLPSARRLGRRAPKFAEIFDLAARATVVGIDLTGSEAKASGFAVLRGCVAETSRIASDDELVAAVVAADPSLVSIDSPLSLPRGRTRVSDDDPGRETYGILRVSERTLKRRGINVYPCLLPSMQKLTARGIILAQRLRALGIPVIESYPGAAQDIMGIPRKGAGEKWLTLGLSEFGIEGSFSRDAVSHDELDAITSALVGTFFLEGRYEALDGPEENALIVPDLIARQKSLLVGLSGRISAGKTTAARMLERSGYVYIRFSAIIDDVIRSQGLPLDRVTRQRVGMEIHETSGQHWLCQQVLERIADAPRAVIDGLRWPEDRAFFVERFGGHFLHIHLEADRPIRARRYASEEPQGRSFEEAETQLVESAIDALGRHAAVTLRNESTLATLESQIATAVELAAGKVQDACLSQSS